MPLTKEDVVKLLKYSNKENNLDQFVDIYVDEDASEDCEIQELTDTAIIFKEAKTEGRVKKVYTVVMPLDRIKEISFLGYEGS